MVNAFTWCQLNLVKVFLIFNLLTKWPSSMYFSFSFQGRCSGMWLQSQHQHLVISIKYWNVIIKCTKHREFILLFVSVTVSLLWDNLKMTLGLDGLILSNKNHKNSMTTNIIWISGSQVCFLIGIISCNYSVQRHKHGWQFSTSLLNLIFYVEIMHLQF